MKYSNYELNLVVGGRPITEYLHQGNIFVEGRKGSEFALEFRNNTYQRVLVVPSVDGKSVLDGKTATPDSRGFIVNAHSTLSIPGWMLDQGNAAKFVFENKDRSYASQTAQMGETLQVGVVGVMVFGEMLPKSVIVNTVYNPNNIPIGVPQSWPFNGTAANPGWGSTCSATSNSLEGVAMASANNIQARSVAKSVETNVVHDSFDMGTGFGQKTEFKTKESTFDKGSQVALMSIYYDSRRNLEKRGIEVVKRETRYLSDLPQAFSGGCTPPPGWQG